MQGRVGLAGTGNAADRCCNVEMRGSCTRFGRVCLWLIQRACANHGPLCLLLSPWADGFGVGGTQPSPAERSPVRAAVDGRGRQAAGGLSRHAMRRCRAAGSAFASERIVVAKSPENGGAQAAAWAFPETIAPIASKRDRRGAVDVR
jgi:hypothetical protein